MRVLVTGATGFICTSLLDVLTREGHETIAVVRHRDAVVKRSATVIWDIGDGQLPHSLPQKVDAVVHAAQSRRYREFPADSSEMFRVNVAGSWSVFDYAVQAKAEHFCLLSSGTVYEPYRGPLTEDGALAPPSFLGATKLAAEILAHPYRGLFDLSILRLFAPYGPGQEARLVPDIIRRVRTGMPVQLAADGEGPWFTPTFVDDIAKIVTAAISESWTGTINVASPGIVSLRHLAEAIGRVLGTRPIFDITDREPLRIVPSLERLSTHYEMTRFTPLESALTRVISASA